MKKWFLFSLLVVLMALHSHAQVLVSQTGIALGNANGVALVLAGANVRVCSTPTSDLPPCNTLAVVYQVNSDGTCSNTPIANPTNADSSGNYKFCIAPGSYVVETSMTRYGTVRVPLQVASKFAGGGETCTAGSVVIGLNPDGSLICATEGTTSAAPHNLLSVTHTDTTAAAVTRGAVITGQGASPTWSELLKGTANQCLMMDSTGTDVIWSTCSTPITLPPPFAIPAGQAVAWAFPTTCAAGAQSGPYTNGYAMCGSTSGLLGMTHSSGLANWGWFNWWTGFTMPSLPNDAVIQGIYGVFITKEAGTPYQASIDLACDGANAITPGSVSIGGHAATYPGTVGAAGEWYTGTLGSTATQVTGAGCAARFFETLAMDGSSTLTTNQIALAIYYTTANPPALQGFVFPAGTDPAIVSPSFNTLTDGATITWDFGLARQINSVVTLGGNRTINLTNMVSGSKGKLIVIQDATGSRTLTLGTGCTQKVVNGGAGALSLTAAASSIDILNVIYDGTNCYWSYEGSSKNFN